MVLPCFSHVILCEKHGNTMVFFRNAKHLHRTQKKLLRISWYIIKTLYLTCTIALPYFWTCTKVVLWYCVSTFWYECQYYGIAYLMIVLPPQYLYFLYGCLFILHKNINNNPNKNDTVFRTAVSGHLSKKRGWLILIRVFNIWFTCRSAESSNVNTRRSLVLHRMFLPSETTSSDF